MRFATFALLLAGGLCAAPPLTTIQDVIYKADGTPFRGVAFIEWKSFSAADDSNIATHSVTVEIVNGNLRVQLVPTTNASAGAYYSVRYNSDGRIQFQETWAVPPSTRPLKLKDVRITAPFPYVTPPAADTQILESDVTGLVDDLAARPVKGAGYTSSRVAFINAAGALDAVAGSPSDCVRADGSTGPCGDAAPGFADGEIPAGVVDGSNAAFTLADAPSPPASLFLYRNGILQKSGLDYSINGAGITFATGCVPQPGDVLLASYRTGGASGSSAGVPQVVCSGAGTSTASTSLTQLGSCTVPTALLRSGDRIEIRFDYSHTGGTGTGFTIAAHWNSASLVARTAAAGETIVAGKSDAVIDANGIQWNAQSWGAALNFAAGVGSASTSAGLPAVVALFGQMAGSTTETIALRNFTVLRYPGQ